MGKNKNMARDAKYYEANLGEHKFKAGEERAKECGRKGGIKCAENKRARKSMMEDAKMLLNLKMKAEELIDIEEVDSMQEAYGVNLNAQQAIFLRLIEEALNGDVKAAQFLRDTIGEAPANVQKIDTNADISLEIMNGILDQLKEDDE